MKWEYEIVSRKLENQYLNAQGEMGWELVCVLPGVGGEKIFVFKQPKLKPNAG